MAHVRAKCYSDRIMKLAVWIAIPLLATLAGASARADDASAPAAAAPATDAASAPAASSAEAGGDGDESAPVVKKPRKGRRGGREKEAEGTQAPNRFEADTVIKSQYKLDGQLLEVDPD